MATRTVVSPAALRQLLDYDPATGALRWRKRDVAFFAHCSNPTRSANAWNAKYAGRPAFSSVGSHGYREGAIFNQNYLAHRVAYAHFHGVWPEVIDHINGNGLDNCAANLRDVPQFENMRNMRGKKARNRSGETGVSWRESRGKWRSRIMVGGVDKTLGHFDSFEEAVRARRTALAKAGFSDRHGSLA